MLDIQQKLESLGFIIKSSIKTGKICRVATQYKPNKRNGWYIVNEHSVSYGSWDESIEDGYFLLNEEEFKAKSDQERQDYFRRIQHERELAYQAEKEKRQKEIQQYSQIVSPLKEKNHDYLQRKKIDLNSMDFGGLLQKDIHNNLVIPMFSKDRQVVGYQMIDKEGNKTFKSGSTLKESFFVIKPTGTTLLDMDIIFICEGFATGASVYMAMNELECNYCVVLAFNSNNLPNVSSVIKSQVQNKNIYVVADNDINLVEVKDHVIKVWRNPGVEEAIKCNLPVIIPSKDVGDANDVHVNLGIEELSNQINNQMTMISNQQLYAEMKCIDIEREILAIALPHGLAEQLPLHLFSKQSIKEITVLINHDLDGYDLVKKYLKNPVDFNQKVLLEKIAQLSAIRKA